MSTLEYLVVARNHADLPSIYEYGEKIGAILLEQKAISTSTLYLLTEEQVNLFIEFRPVARVVFKPDKSILSPTLCTNNDPYTVSGNFSKYAQVDSYYQWGFLHCAGNDTQRRKGTWGIPVDPSAPLTDVVNDTVGIFNDGKNVDVVIMDDLMSYDCEEWLSPTTGLSRFVEYQWFNELSQYMGSGAPTGTIAYWDNASNPYDHGNHVAGTVAGQFYGWAREANIYSIPYPGASFVNGEIISDSLVFDYVAAFHKYKPVNPLTGRKNPTVLNCSWAYQYTGAIETAYPSGWSFSDLGFVFYDGTYYDSSSPNPSGWTEIGVECDFGISSSKNYVQKYTFMDAEIQQCVDEGVIVVASAGNYNNESLKETSVGYNDYFYLNAGVSVYYRTGASPASNVDCISVGALSNYEDFRRAYFSTFGERVDTWAPGVEILSAFNAAGAIDTKYGPNNYYSMNSGTSMASPQVSGIAALICSSRPWSTQTDIRGYLRKASKYNDMTFDSEAGGPSANTFQVEVSPDSNGVDWYAEGADPFLFYLTGQDITFSYYENDTLEIKHKNRNHYITVSGVNGTSDYNLEWYDPDNNFLQGLDIPIIIDEGESLGFLITAASAGHPLYIRSILNDPNSDIPSVSGQGVQVDGEFVLWQTNIGDAGTYYYQCGIHSGMYGTITVQPAGTTYNNPLYIKTAPTTGSGDLLAGGTNQGTFCPGTGVLSIQLPIGTFYYQHGNDANLSGIIDVQVRPGVLGQTGNYADPTCQKNSANAYPLVTNPRNDAGYIDDSTYLIRETSGGVYPRRKISMKQ